MIAFGGDLVADGRFFDLTRPEPARGARVQLVLVHGARPQIEARLKELGHRGRFHGGCAITDDVALGVRQGGERAAARGDRSAAFDGTAQFPDGGRDIRVASGNFITAKPLGGLSRVDLLHTGEVRKVDAAAILKRLADNELVWFRRSATLRPAKSST